MIWFYEKYILDIHIIFMKDNLKMLIKNKIKYFDTSKCSIKTTL